MKRDLAWWLRIVVPTVAVASLGAAWVVGDNSGRPTETGGTTTGTVGAQGVTLVAYNSCDGALSELRRAAFPLVGPYGFGDQVMTADAAPGGVVPKGAVPAPNPGPTEGRSSAGIAAPADQQAPDHSTTNTH